MSEVLLVDDEPDLLDLLSLFLSREGFAVRTAESGEEAWQMAQQRRPDLAIVDWMMPGMSGLDLLHRFRATELLRTVPVLLLTARDAVEDRVRGFEAGADDYVSKPYSRRELVSRVRVLLRSPEVVETPRFATDRLRVAPGEWRAWLDDNALDLTAQELRLLALLLERPGRAWSRQELLERVWGAVRVDPRTIDTHVRNLRDKLGDARDLIETIRGVGYRIATA